MSRSGYVGAVCWLWASLGGCAPPAGDEPALGGVRFRPSSAAAILRRNVFIYGVGGIVAPFIFIKLIDLIITATGVF